MKKIISLLLCLCLVVMFAACGKETASVGAGKEENVENDMNENKTEKLFPEYSDATEIVSKMRFGWNLGNTLEAHSDSLNILCRPSQFETCWGNPVTTQETIDYVIDKNINVIRIPVTWSGHFGGEPGYVIAPTWMERVKEVVDYAYSHEDVYVILNMHHETFNYAFYDNEEKACEIIRAIWAQIAECFKDYDERLIFESMNEPRKVGDAKEWTGGDKEGYDVVNAMNMAFYDTIRNDANENNRSRLLLMPGYAACETGLKALTLPENDNRVIASVHAYIPYDYALNIKGRSNWKNDTHEIDGLMKTINSYYVKKGKAVIIGEFGALNKDNESDRAEWAYYYVSAAKKIGVPCVWWDNGCYNTDGENFGLINRLTGEIVYPQIMDAINRALDE